MSADALCYPAFDASGVRAVQYTTALLYIGPRLMRPPREETTWPAH
jgi:hypothetical protein